MLTQFSGNEAIQRRVFRAIYPHWDKNTLSNLSCTVVVGQLQLEHPTKTKPYARAVLLT